MQFAQVEAKRKRALEWKSNERTFVATTKLTIWPSDLFIYFDKRALYEPSKERNAALKPLVLAAGKIDECTIYLLTYLSLSGDS